MVVKANRQRNVRLIGLVAFAVLLAAAGAWRMFRVSGLLAAGASFALDLRPHPWEFALYFDV